MTPPEQPSEDPMLLEPPEPLAPRSEVPLAPEVRGPLGPIVIARFLLCDAGAIRRVWGDPWSLALGALLLVSAALARHHDRHDLVREWHVLLHGLGASLVNSMALYALMRLAWRRRLGYASFWRGYAGFLGVFWMTSPLAWLYGVPYESWLNPSDAVRANLWTLALVSVWRVALMARVLQVVLGVHPMSAFWIVMLFANIAASAALLLAPLPTIQFMGGLDSRPAEVQFMARVAFQVGCGAVLLLPVSLIAGIACVAKCRPRSTALPGRVRAPRPTLVMALVLVIIAAWSWASWRARPALVRRDRLEALVARQEFAQAAAFMAALEREDFPPAWSPPRKADGHEATMLAMALALDEAGAPAWALRAYATNAGHEAVYWGRHFEIERDAAAREKRIAVQYGSRERFVAWLRIVVEHDEPLTEETRAEGRRLLEALTTR